MVVLIYGFQNSKIIAFILQYDVYSLHSYVGRSLKNVVNGASVVIKWLMELLNVWQLYAVTFTRLAFVFSISSAIKRVD